MNEHLENELGNIRHCAADVIEKARKPHKKRSIPRKNKQGGKKKKRDWLSD